MMDTIIVTGAAGDLGSAITERLLLDGYRVIGMVRTIDDRLKKYKSTENIQYCAIELSNEQEYKESIKRLCGYEHRITGIVHNAAVAYDDIVTNADLVKLRMMYEVNVFSAVWLVKQAIRNMLYHQTNGSIVFISSISAHTGYSGLTMYGSTKGALESLSRGISREWGRAGIRSNTVVPGFMRTKMNSEVSEDTMSRIFRRTALGAPTEIASVVHAIQFLLSSDAKSITGQNIIVDSGTI